MRSTQLRLSIVSACWLYQRELNAFFPHHLRSSQYATSLSPARASSSHNALAQSTSSSHVSHSYHPASVSGDSCTPPGAVGPLSKQTCVSTLCITSLFPHAPFFFSFLYLPSFLIYYFSLLFWLLLIHLLRTDEYWATHLNSTYMKWDVLVPEWPVKAVVCHMLYHNRTTCPAKLSVMKS